MAQPGDGFDVDIAGNETSSLPNTYEITSPPTLEPIYVSFNYGFSPTTLGALAEFRAGGTPYQSLSPAQLTAVGPVFLATGQSFSFRLTNDGEQPILGINDFSSTPVPIPLPILGSAAAFGWIRRRRSRLMERQPRR
ncbi:MAG: hypothetical protein FJ083_18370 [Cyanobacteria bacterium K_Offshore_surface_m2_239]|nr:hypothetical protein [Cyanobacteria bacterium K_Offshore_surface_m2_239]